MENKPENEKVKPQPFQATTLRSGYVIDRNKAKKLLEAVSEHLELPEGTTPDIILSNLVNLGVAPAGKDSFRIVVVLKTGAA